MAKRRRKRRGTKGQHCARYKTVRVKGRGMQRRCASFVPGAAPKRRRRRRK
jgi:hypothetical protein